MYFIAAVTTAEIDGKVRKWKNRMKELYNCEVALRSPAHITLVPPYWMNPELEHELLNDLSIFSNSQQDFPVRLNNFSHFDHRVLFVNVVVNHQLSRLRNELISFLSSKNKYPFKTDERPFHPHVTIATRDLHKKDFLDAWNYFEDKSYEAEWILKDVSLLRNADRKWEVIN